jgi:hypothetical protein
MSSTETDSPFFDLWNDIRRSRIWDVQSFSEEVLTKEIKSITFRAYGQSTTWANWNTNNWTISLNLRGVPRNIQIALIPEAGTQYSPVCAIKVGMLRLSTYALKDYWQCHRGYASGIFFLGSDSKGYIDFN